MSRVQLPWLLEPGLRGGGKASLRPWGKGTCVKGLSEGRMGIATDPKCQKQVARTGYKKEELPVGTGETLQPVLEGKAEKIQDTWRQGVPTSPPSMNIKRHHSLKFCGIHSRATRTQGSKTEQ